MRKLNFALIGCGRISKNHIKGLHANRDNAELAAVCDLVPEKMEQAVNYYKELCNTASDVKKYLDYRQLLENEDIDIVNVAVESGLHAEISIEAMKAGKHVIVEKPMALSIKDADDMIAASKKYNVKLCVCFQNRYNLAVKKLMEAHKEGSFGKLVHGVASIRWNRNDDYYKQAKWRGTWKFDGGTLMNQCTHNIDLLQLIMGDVDSVYAQADTFLRPIEGEDCAAVVLRFKNGALGIIEGSSCVYPRNLEEILNIFGEKGTACLGGIALNHIEVWKFEGNQENESEVMRNYGENPNNVYGFGHGPLFEDMIKSIRSNKEAPIPGEQGKKSLEIILAAYKSVKTGMPVKLPLKDFSTMDMIEL